MSNRKRRFEKRLKERRRRQEENTAKEPSLKGDRHNVEPGSPIYPFSWHNVPPPD